MGDVQGMLATARSLLGTTEHPPGSNRNVITKWYGFTGPWCDMAVSYVAAHSDNLSATGGKYALTTAHARAFQKKGHWHYGIGGIRPGDIVFFDWSGSRSIGAIDHVGIVEAVHSNRTITTLEGNSSNAFRRRLRSSACVVGYGRPAYAGGSAPMPAGGNNRGVTGQRGQMAHGARGVARVQVRVATLVKQIHRRRHRPRPPPPATSFGARPGFPLVLRQPAQRLDELAPRDDVQAGRRFVEQQRLRPVHQRTRDQHAAHFSGGEYSQLSARQRIGPDLQQCIAYTFAHQRVTFASDGNIRLAKKPVSTACSTSRPGMSCRSRPRSPVTTPRCVRRPGERSAMALASSNTMRAWSRVVAAV